MEKARILIVEDEAVLAADLSSCLENMGYEACGIATSAEKAYERARQNRPDLVLMDIVLRGRTDGIEAADRFRAEFDTPVVFLTSYTDKELLDRAKRAQPLGFLVKPFQDRELKAVLEVALYGARADQERRRAEEELRLELNVNLALSEMAKFIISRAPDPFSIANVVLEYCRKLSGSEHGCISSIDPRTGDNVGQAWTKIVPDQCRVPDDPRKIVFPRNEDGCYDGLWGRGLNARTAFYLNDIDGRIAHSGPAWDHPLPLNFLAVPVLMGNELLGQIALANSLGGYNDKDLKVISQIAGLYSLALYRLRAEEERAGFMIQLQQDQKMKALGTLVAGVAHEVNNPINLITLNTALIQRVWKDLLPVLRESVGRDAQAKFGGLPFGYLQDNLLGLLSDMEMAANRVTRIVSGLKDFARVSDVQQKSPTQVNEAVENALRLVGTTLRKSNIDLKLSLYEGMPKVEGNLSSLEQVLVNLLVNAIQSIKHEQGLIEVITGIDAEKGQVFITVQDNGLGIDPAIAEEIFNPFFTSKQAEGGTGLGLSISHSLIRNQNGDITFESRPGEGTVFKVTVPLTDRTTPRKILVVDDDEQIRDLVTRTLVRNRSHQVIEAANGEEACIKLGLHRPDLLVLDIFMPVMDGIEVCRALQGEPGLWDTQVIIISGHTEHPKLNEAAQMGYSNIMGKPLDLGLFLDLVDDLLGER